MGVRSTTAFLENGKPIGAIYKQYGSEISNWGLKLKEFVRKKEWDNGVIDNETFNGIRDFATQLIAYYKYGSGDIYLTSPDDEQEINYIINCKTDRFCNPVLLEIVCLEHPDFNETIKLKYF